MPSAPPCRPFAATLALLAALPALAAGPNEALIAFCAPAGPGQPCACSVEAIENPIGEAALHDYLHRMRRAGLLNATEFSALAENAVRACAPATDAPPPLLEISRTTGRRGAAR